MNDLWLGASKDEAQCVFLLPNKPMLSKESDCVLSRELDAALLIELNGNHWRKILTIMAKLVVPHYDDWREFRDKDLLKKVGIAFTVDQLDGYQGKLFIVGNTFRDAWPVPDFAKEIGEGHVAAFSSSCVWCPYLDYRQFPNVLIEKIRKTILEK
ncbi:hypothetical protein MUS1_06905 [Marinomonas ushuaiensis DSM 15871]|uniref:Uncharacterized protein n=1 Tax=Marinomonas ushuaiensis DSM 15871 TaxID=1122207 RepID=X7E0S2_9GAMM|nr:hypothetical protein [Marinomonas ushuaiensis]ETX09557.1 hypothetical protein MUS1_06905 [Marinomonas ushuaiensis DSM 15871]